MEPDRHPAGDHGRAHGGRRRGAGLAGAQPAGRFRDSGLKEIGKDKIGREALQAKLKAIRIRYDEKTAPASNYANGLRFENGVLDVNGRPFANVADFKDRVAAVTAVLEKTL